MVPPPLAPPRRPRVLVPRGRAARERELVLRGLAAAARGDFGAPAAAPFAAERFAVELFAGDLREVDALPALADFPRVEGALVAAFRVPLLRDADARFAGFADALRALLDFAEDDALLVLAELSIDHLPDMIRCAASATASAMIEPSLVALEAIALAACEAVSAASSPASRIFLRAAGLALIAAAAAARPAASISLLIAAFASLSTVVLFELELDEDELERGEDVRDREDVERDELLRVGLAMAFLPPCAEKDTLRPLRFPNEVAICKVMGNNRKEMPSACAPHVFVTDMLKGTAASRSDALRHGQRPEMWPFVSS